MGKIANLVKEIQIKEKLRSPRQVFERYPHLGELYYKEFREEREQNGHAESKNEDSVKDNKELLLD